MKLQDFFEKQINRNIETVVKADDREHISDEVAEYVITNEIGKKIRDLFSSYIDYTGVNGVWISGFFGSGKSHLLKILSYVLENKENEGYKCGELFAEKIEEDEMLKADILKACSIPSESILFNIDQQADTTSKKDNNAILSVFYKVFYDHLGFYGKTPHVAEFEMWLSKEGIYEDFKQKFEASLSKPWEEGRRDYFDPDVEDTITEVLSELKGNEAEKYEGILDKMEDNQTASIEDFCERVFTYIKSKPKDFRLNFFVDEVGQYISDNTKLMLNLQTIAESLATKTKGRSWILVTSQEDMETVVGDMNKQQSNDFSRIQARFALKISLTSANVDEVIEKRLLKKKKPVIQDLVTHWENEKSNLETLMSFSEAGVQFKSYQSETDFANKFPFPAYQFDLFQQCRRALSSHNAFQGKQAAIGERSMLGVFQQVVLKLGDKDINTLVSFDKMYEGIRNELRGEIQSVVILAEKNLSDSFTVSVLKTLFMIKYFRNFKATQRNISVLMLDNIHIDINEHEQKVKEALAVLENQSYIQRSGEVYEFLTDDEKDIEQEIKSVDLADTAVNTLTREIFFDEIIRDTKIRFEDNKQDYIYSPKVDGGLFGREHELQIELITPQYLNYESESLLKSETMNTNVLRLVLSSSETFYKDLRLFLRTEKYVKQSNSASNRPELKRILQEKAQLNSERRKQLLIQAKELLSNAQVVLNGSFLPADGTTEPRTKVQKNFQLLIKNVYPNLKMLGTHIFKEQDFQALLQKKGNDSLNLFANQSEGVTEAEQEIFNFTNRRKKASDRTSLDDIQKQFSKAPYGWYNNATWTMVARLYKKGKIELRMDSRLLEDNDVLASLSNNRRFANTLLEPQMDIDPKTIRKLKEVYKDAFDEVCPVSEGKDVAEAFKRKVTELSKTVRELINNKSSYPFVESLTPFQQNLNDWGQEEYQFFLTDINKIEDKLLDMKEDLLTPLLTFWNGDQKKIYDDIKRLVEGDFSNFDYVEGDELLQLKKVLQDKKPWTKIKEAKATKDTLRQKLHDTLEAEKQTALNQLDAIVEEFKQKDEFASLPEAQQERLLEPFTTLFNKIKTQRFIATLKDMQNQQIKQLKLEQWNKLSETYEKLNAKPEPAPVVYPERNSNGTESKVAEKPVAKPAPKPSRHYVSKGNIKVAFAKSELHTPEDVEAYVEALKEAYLKQIKDRNIML